MNCIRFNLMTFARAAQFAILVSCCAAVTAQDKVYPLQGSALSGKIAEITRNEVSIEVRGNKQTLPLTQVRKITFEGEPSGLDRARELFAQQQFDQARDEIRKLDVAAAKSPQIAQEMEFYGWYCEGKLGLIGAGGDKAKAAAGLLALSRTNANSHHMYDVAEMLGDLAVSLGRADSATTYYNLLLQSPSPDTKARGVYALANLELTQNKTAEAKTRFEQLAAATAATPEMTRIKNLAEVGLAVCKIRGGQAQEALTQLKSMVEKNDSTDQELFARIYNAQGACFTTLNQSNLAVLAYLRTDLLFFTDPDAHAEALYYLSNLWAKIGEPSRASDAKARLVAAYAGSSWANK